MYDIELFIIKPGVSLKLEKVIKNKIKKAGFVTVVEKKATLSLKDMEKFYGKPNNELVSIGSHVVEFGKEHTLDIKKIYGTLSPLLLGKKIMLNQAKYMASGKSTILIEMIKIKKGLSSFEVAKKLVGSTYPEKAEKGTIRSLSKDSLMYATEQGRAIHNFIHSSDEDRIEYELSIIKKYLHN